VFTNWKNKKGVGKEARKESCSERRKKRKKKKNDEILKKCR